MKKTKELKELTSKQSLDRLYDRWALVFVGLDPSPNNIEFALTWLNKYCPTKKITTDNLSIIKGKTMNEYSSLSGDNAYPDWLCFVAVDYSNIEDLEINKMATQRFGLNVPSRWFPDIVDNDRRREKENDENEDAYEDAYDEEENED